MPDARLVSLAVASPEREYAQAEIAREAAGVFGADSRLAPLVALFATCGVERRRLALPLAEYARPRPFGERNRIAVAAATDLAERAIDAALAAAGLGRRDLDHLVLASTTGIATPSVDALLLHRMGLRPDLERTPLFGVGCCAGAVGLSRAADLARARPGARVALVAVEVCSLTFRIDDLSPKNVVGAALFADGAACAIVEAAPGDGPRVVAHRSHTFADSLEIMGWRVDGEGLELVLSRDLPALVEREVEPLVRGFLAEHGVKTRELERFVVHPGGPRIIDAAEQALGLAPGRLDPTRRFLAAHGNLSSASVLFILRDLLDGDPPGPGERALLLAFGPGFSAELLLLEW